MLDILASDFYKLGKSRAFWLCLALCLLFAVIMVAAMQAGITRITGGRGGGAFIAGIAENVSAAFALTIFIPASFHLIVIAVFVSLFVASEFNFGTMKNTLSRGAPRPKVFFSKIIVCSFSSMFMFLAFVIAIIVTGVFFWGPGGMAPLAQMVSMVSLQGLMVLGYTALFTFVSMSLRGTGGAIATNVLTVTVAPTLLAALSMLLDAQVRLDDFWLEWGVSNLASYTPEPGHVIRGVLIAFFWGLASIAAGLVLFSKQDVK